MACFCMCRGSGEDVSPRNFPRGDRAAGKSWPRGVPRRTPAMGGLRERGPGERDDSNAPIADCGEYAAFVFVQGLLRSCLTRCFLSRDSLRTWRSSGSTWGHGVRSNNTSQLFHRNSPLFVTRPTCLCVIQRIPPVYATWWSCMCMTCAKNV